MLGQLFLFLPFSQTKAETAFEVNQDEGIKNYLMEKIKKILITGSSGTIGTMLFEKLLEGGYKVAGFDKDKNQWHSRLNKLTIIGNLLNKKEE